MQAANTHARRTVPDRQPRPRNSRRGVRRGVGNVFSFFNRLFRGIINSPIFWCITFSFSIALLYRVILHYKLIGFFLPADWIKEFPTVKEFINWLGIPYSFLISMTLLRAWERADEVNSGLRKEAHSIAVLLDSVDCIPPECFINATNKRELISCIERYVSHVEDLYDSEYEDLLLKQEGDRRLKTIEQAIETEMNARNPVIPAFADLKWKKLFEVMSARKDRLSSAKGHMPGIFWLLLVLISVLWLMLFGAVTFEDPWLGFSLIFFVTFIVTTLIVTILLFNEPTSMEWNDISNSWRELRRKIDACRELRRTA